MLSFTFESPSSISKIESETFVACQNLISIIIPSSVTSIDSSAFLACTNLSSITFSSPSSISKLKFQTFAGCTNLTSFTIPPSVKSIENEAFVGCSLKSLIIPSSVDSFGDKMFGGNVPLESIFEYSKIPIELGTKTKVFYGVDTSKCILYVPYGSVKAYKEANQWKAFNRIKEMPYISFPDSIIYVLNSSAGSSATINVSSNTSWQVNSNQSWLFVNPTSITNGNSSITFMATENSGNERTATITIKGDSLVSKTITVTQKSGITFINNVESNNISIYPNPAKSTFIINGINEAKVEIYNLNSQLIVTTSAKGNEPISLKDIPAGIYFIKIITDNAVVTKRLLLE